MECNRMSRGMIRTLTAALVLCAVPLAALAQGPAPAGSLDELLAQVREGYEAKTAEKAQRLAAFRSAGPSAQESQIGSAIAELTALEATAQELENTYNDYEKQLAEFQGQLDERIGDTSELFAVVRQVAADLGSFVWDSLTSAQLPGRRDFLDELAQGRSLPTTGDLEKLWSELLGEMTAGGKISRFQADVLTSDGQVAQKEVVRAGPFTAISGGKFLLWEVVEQKLRELTRQPASKYLATVDDFQGATSGIQELAIDPSRGSLLSALTDTPSVIERVNQGGLVGYVIITLGSLAALLGVVRWAVVSVVGRKVDAQRKDSVAREDNPLGRILAVHEANRDVDAETLELKLDEAVLRESSRLERFIWLVKTVSVVSPLLGLLGTVTGMIATFQAITLFGAGDPKLMAGGISEALVTTMLGLCAAIPLVLLHATLSNSTRRINDILDEQSAGLIATRAEHANV